MAFVVTGTIDQGRAAEQIRKRTAREIEKRGQRAAQASVRETENLINREMGPSDGRSERRGLVSMRAMPFVGTCTSGGDFPIVIELENTVSGPSAVKYAAIEFGSRGGEYAGRRAFPGELPTDREGVNVYPHGSTTREGRPGKFFMRRGMALAVAGVYAGFQYTRSWSSAFASR